MGRNCAVIALLDAQVVEHHALGSGVVSGLEIHARVEGITIRNEGDQANEFRRNCPINWQSVNSSMLTLYF